MPQDGPIGSYPSKIPGICCPSGRQIVISNWHVCLSVLSDCDRRISMIEQLSSAQVVSIKLLEEWWWYGCDDRDRYEVTLAEALPEWDPSDARYLYKKKLYHLWYWEFTDVFQNMEPDRLESKIAHLAWVRQTAAEAAAVHRIALAAYHAVTTTGSSSTSQDHGKLSPMGQARLDAHIPACVEPCSWIESARLKKEYPYFLWDKQERSTVHFTKESDVPSYTVISHTWGRFRLGDQVEQVKGVPWNVPCLDPKRLFDVQTLPHILSQFPIPTRYVWLDLVCIPQDGRSLQNIEIGRQAGIFMAAKFAVVWLNQIDGWDGLRSAVIWTALDYLSRDREDRYGVAEWLVQASKSANRPSNLTIPAREEDEGTKEAAWVFENQQNETVTPDRWFTSLWTLQEACLRPDMVVCDKAWKILALGEGESQTPILLDHIVALFERPHPPSIKNVPASAHEIRVLLSSSGLRALVNMTPVDILMLGEVRYCEDTNRAKAIMSALGATDWYSADRKQDLTQLVLGKYPLEFLHECQRRIGSFFFSSVAVHSLHDVFYEQPVLDQTTLDSLKGSMLPFSSGVKDPKLVMNTLFYRKDHPAVSEWLIEREGSVHISRAGVVASYMGPNQYTEDIQANIRPPRKGFRLPPLPDKLHDWMGSFRPFSEKHAVCIFQNLGSGCWGVILERVDAVKNHFVCVGTFDTSTNNVTHTHSDFSCPDSIEVNWRVL